MQNRDLGMLLLRAGIGTIFVWFGLRALLAGSGRWAGIGAHLRSLGIDFWPEIWGVAIALAAVLGGICILSGLLFRAACLVLTAGTAIAFYLAWKGSGVPVDAAVRILLVAGCAFSGPGRYSLGR